METLEDPPQDLKKTDSPQCTEHAGMTGVFSFTRFAHG